MNLNINLDELRNLDFNDIQNWPLRSQLITLGVMAIFILLAGYFVVLGPQRDEIAAAEAREAELKTQYIDQRRQLANLEALQAQLKEIEKSFGSLIRQLPTKAEMASVLAEINQAGVGRGLQFELFRPGQEIRGAELAELPIELRLNGTYNDLATFVSDVARMSRIVTIGDISLTPAAGKDGRLTLQATAKTYRTLEPAERAAATASAKEKGK